MCHSLIIQLKKTVKNYDMETYGDNNKIIMGSAMEEYNYVLLYD